MKKYIKYILPALFLTMGTSNLFGTPKKNTRAKTQTKKTVKKKTPKQELNALDKKAITKLVGLYNTKDKIQLLLDKQQTIKLTLKEKDQLKKQETRVIAYNKALDNLMLKRHKVMLAMKTNKPKKKKATKKKSSKKKK